MAPRRRLPAVVPTKQSHAFIHAEAQKRRVARLAAKAEAAAAPQGSEHHLHMRLPPITHREGSPTLAPALQEASSNPDARSCWEGEKLKPFQSFAVGCLPVFLLLCAGGWVSGGPVRPDARLIQAWHAAAYCAACAIKRVVGFECSVSEDLSSSKQHPLLQ